MQSSAPAFHSHDTGRSIPPSGFPTPSGGASPEAFGLLVLGSPDPGRFTTDMGTTYLARIEEIASAALSRLLK